MMFLCHEMILFVILLFDWLQTGAMCNRLDLDPGVALALHRELEMANNARQHESLSHNIKDFFNVTNDLSTTIEAEVFLNSTEGSALSRYSVVPTLASSTSDISNGKDFSMPLNNWSALVSYCGTLDSEFLDKINPFWLNQSTSKQSHYAIAVAYTVLLLFGLSGNSLVIFMFIWCRSLRTPGNILVINLAVSDFLMIAKSPIAIYNSFTFGPALGEIGCDLYGWVGGLTGTVSIATLTAIAFDRYNVVVNPLVPLRRATKNRSRAMVAFVWIYGLIFSSIPLMNIGLSRYVPEGFLTTCSFDYLTVAMPAKIFMFTFFFFAWCVPFTIIFYCYVHILRVVIQARTCIQSNKDQNKVEIKLAGIVIGVIAIWFVSWTPYAVVALLGITGNKELLSPLASMVPAIFCKTAACMDPYIYAVTHPRFRLEFGKIFLGRTDIRQSQFQTSYCSKGTGRRRVVRDISMDAAVMGDTVNGTPHIKCYDSEISGSVDYDSEQEYRNDDVYI